jgi:hypothetical protein
MNIVTLRETLLYCTIINFGVLAVWALFALLPHHWVCRRISRFWRLTAEQVDAISFAGIVFYEAGILLFNLAPYLALRIAG